MILRAAYPSEWRLLRSIHAASFDRPWSEEAFQSALATPGTEAFVGQTQPGRHSGFVLARTAADEAEILTIGVLEEARGQGLGRALMATSADACFALGARNLFLEVAADNAPALALYAACGFAVAGRRPRYYDRGPDAQAQDALLMRRALPTPAANPYPRGR